MEAKIFQAKGGIDLIVKSSKTAVIFEIHGNDEKLRETRFFFEFTPEKYKELREYIECTAIEIWKDLNPREMNSEASDYWEYYDKELDNNGYLYIHTNHLRIERPCYENKRLYKFNKRKMESFIYDYRKVI